MRWRSGFTRPGPPARRKGCGMSIPACASPRTTYGAKVLGIGPDDVMFSAAKAFHAYGLGNSLTFPMSVGAASVFLPGRPTPDAVLEMMRTHQSDAVRRRSDACTRGCWPIRTSRRAPGRRGCAAASRPARRCRRISAAVGNPLLASISWMGSAPPRCCIFSSATAGRHPLRHQRQAGARAMTRASSMSTTGRCRMAKPGNWWCAATARPTATGTSAPGRGGRSRANGPTPATPIRAMPKGYFRFQGRSDEMLKVSGVWVSPFEVEEALISHPGGAGGRGDRPAGPGRPGQAEGVRDPARRRAGHGRPWSRSCRLM